MIIIQSDPKNENELFNQKMVEHYELLEDLAENKEHYNEERKYIMKKGTTIPSYALSRNFSHGFSAAEKFDVDWWIAILGDVEISSLIGIEKTIEKISQKGGSPVPARPGERFPSARGGPGPPRSRSGPPRGPPCARCPVG